MQQLRTFLEDTETFFALIRGDDFEETNGVRGNGETLVVEENKSAEAELSLEDRPVEAVMLDLETIPETSVQVLGTATIEATLAANEANSNYHDPFQRKTLPTPAVTVNQGIGDARDTNQLSRSWYQGLSRGYLSHRYHRGGLVAMVAQLCIVVGIIVGGVSDLWLLMILLGAFYPIFMIISFCCAKASNLCKFLSNPGKVMKHSDYFDQIPNLPMRLVHCAHCYRMITNDTGNGEVCITKHYAKQEFNYTSSMDITEYPAVSNISLCVVRFSKSYQFSDEPTRLLFNLSKLSFQENHQYCDDERRFRTDFIIEGLHDKILSFREQDDIPDVLRNGQTLYFHLLTLFCGISWFYYVWFDGIIEERSVEVKRVVTY